MGGKAKRTIKPLRGAFVVATLMQQHTEIMQCVDVIRMFFENRAITTFRFGHMACLMEI